MWAIIRLLFKTFKNKGKRAHKNKHLVREISKLLSNHYSYHDGTIKKNGTIMSDL